MKKLKIHPFYYRVINFQVFDGLSLEEALKAAVESSKDDYYKTPSAKYAYRKLQSYDYKAYKMELLNRIRIYEPTITNQIADITN